MDDLISRQVAIDSLTEIIMNLKNVYGDMGSAVNGARECIKSLPSAKSEQNKGEWIRKQPVAIGEPRFICSECHGQFRNPYNFCPNCGADMRGEHE